MMKLCAVYSFFGNNPLTQKLSTVNFLNIVLTNSAETKIIHIFEILMLLLFSYL